MGKGHMSWRDVIRAAGPAMVAVAVCLTPAPAPQAGVRSVSMDDASACSMAVSLAQADQGVPDGLLGAIARTESGRADPATGTVGPWPWTINANGVGQFFATKQDAVAGVLRLQERGVASIDVGCMQINLRSHPGAFASLEDAFDPQRNADYAARFLVLLYGRSGTWMGAAMAYHSLNPELGAPYGARVAAAWGGQAGEPAPASALASASAFAPAPRLTVVSPAPETFEPGTMFPVLLPAAFHAAVPLPRHRSAVANLVRGGRIGRLTLAAR